MVKHSLIFFVLLILFGQIAVPSGHVLAQENPGQESLVLQEEKAELERQLAEYESQIVEIEKTLGEYNKQGKTLKNEISSLNAKISKLNLQIKAVNLSLLKVNQEITETQKQINRTENKINDQKAALSETVRNIYEADNQNLMIIMLANEKLSNFFNDLNNIVAIQDKLRLVLNDIVKTRQDLLQQKEELVSEKEDAENLKAIQESQKKNVQSTQTQKTDLLKVTKGKESEYQKLLKKTQESAAQIRNRIFELLGGGELTFEKAYELAKIAEGATGVRSALILAILNRESLLGKNVGRCDYQKAMHPTRDIPVFLRLLDAWKAAGILIPEPIKVSCANADGAYGGAMGPAQFIPSTWNLFASQISAITGSNPPSPWKNADAFAATALYLKNSGADKSSPSSEKKAAARYYCGGSWQRTSCQYYANKVMETATKFQKDIDIISS